MGMKPTEKQTVYFKTFGCRTNQFDTQVMMSKLKDHTLSQSETESDVVVVNSCTVTNGADVSVRNYIASLQRKNPKVKVVLAGCGAHAKGESLFKEKGLFGVMGHSEKENINALLLEEKPFYSIGDLTHIDESIVEEFIGKSRAFIKIQEGCDFECSYCIIPSVRGTARSHDETLIVEQVTKLAANGFGECILTGTNVGSYGKDTQSSIATLLKKLSQIRGVRRIRLGSLEPSQIDDAFLELLDEPWMAKHLHIALQHTSDEMLARMQRRNRFKNDLALFETIASHGYALGTDYIVGHPGESEALWKEAIANVELLPLTHIHAFSYSKRDGTASATMKPEVRGDIAKARHRELSGLIAQKNLQFRKKHHTNLEVLVESGKEGLYYGFDQYYNKVAIQSSEELSANWVWLENVEVDHGQNRATL
jgi:threonylcarbamoyladenosine tRNA methylthiotransferase MtaB